MKPAKKKVQRYQGPNGSTVRRLRMTEEQYKDAIRTSANKVLLDLLDRPDHEIHELTVRPQHKIKLLTWKCYCDRKYGGDYTVNADRILPYFEEVVFTRTSKKYITPDTGYDVIIGLRPKGWKPQTQSKNGPPNRPHMLRNGHRSHHLRRQVKRTGPLNVPRQPWQDLRSLINNTINELNALGSMVEKDETGMDLDSEELEFGRKVPAIEQYHSPEPCIIETEAEKQRVFAGRIPDKYGRIDITVPLTLGTTTTARLINNESVPDFSDADKWKEVKVLVPTDVPIVPDLGSGPDAETEHQIAQEKLDLAAHDGIRPRQDTKEDIFFEAKSNIPAAQSGIEQSAQTGKIAFLKLLVRIRRVIIQDAVLCLHWYLAPAGPSPIV
ncbi:hypothetical protein BGZ95_005958 [Linnemannia exigua]|uniref:Uncharacterized protein n=1 Tax=Linnemannia exigua TaxID=604196 RepID=A0AAD4D340_9FUNG|nr:hypothetical protein BGZ95_005958 [Linnemannia exigua]